MYRIWHRYVRIYNTRYRRSGIKVPYLALPRDTVTTNGADLCVHEAQLTWTARPNEAMCMVTVVAAATAAARCAAAAAAAGVLPIVRRKLGLCHEVGLFLTRL